MAWDKGLPYGHQPKWSDKVSAELIEIRQHLVILEAKVEAMKSGGTADATGGARPIKEVSEFGKGSDFSSVEKWQRDMNAAKEYDEMLRTKITDIESEITGKEGLSTEDLVHVTYAIHEATHAMRGYLMFLDQLGLSKDQKHLIRELEYFVMMITKLTTAILVIAGMMEAGFTPLGIFVAGGMGAASLGYGMKIAGGGL